MLTRASPTTSTEVVDTLRHVASGDWDVLAGGNVMASHGWLRAVERSGIADLEPRYVLRRDGGRLVGAAVCYVGRGAGTGSSPDRLLLGRLYPLAARLRLSFLPAVVCAPYRGYGAHLLGAEPDVLLNEVEALAHAAALPLHLPRVLDEETALCRLLSGRGYHRTVQEPIACLEIEWDTFEGYLASLRRISPKAPRIVRHEMNRNRRAGIVIREIDDAAALAARLHDLAEAHHVRLNRASVPYQRHFLPWLKATLGERCVLYGAFHGEELLGFTLMLRDGDTAILPFLGIDDTAKGDFTYFNLCYYRPIADAIAGGLKRVFFGTLLYDLKARRGCRILKTNLFYKSAARARHLTAAPWFRCHRWWAEHFKFANVHGLGSPRRRPS